MVWHEGSGRVRFWWWPSWWGLHESRLVKLDLKPEETPHIDEQAEELSEDEEEAATSARYRKWAALEKIVAAQPRLAQVAEDLVKHFEERQKTEFQT